MCGGMTTAWSGGVTINQIKWCCIGQDLFEVSQNRDPRLHEVLTKGFKTLVPGLCGRLGTPSFTTGAGLPPLSSPKYGRLSILM